MKYNLFRYFIFVMIVRFNYFFKDFSIPFMNIASMICHTGINFKKYIISGQEMWQATEKQPTGGVFNHYFHMSERAHIYLRGVNRRGQQLAAEYGIDGVPIVPDDIIIDVGSNSGDLLIYLSGLEIPLTVCCFEPDPVAFRSLELNCKRNSRFYAINQPLSDKNESAFFYMSSLGGDSSLSKPGKFDSQIQVNTIKFDDWISQQTFIAPEQKIKVLKLEAEGFEPEILKGAEKTLSRICYIAADLGWERGLEQECTIPESVNFLLQRGFGIDRVARNGSHYLFKNILFDI